MLKLNKFALHMITYMKYSMRNDWADGLHRAHGGHFEHILYVRPTFNRWRYSVV